MLLSLYMYFMLQYQQPIITLYVLRVTVSTVNHYVICIACYSINSQSLRYMFCMLHYQQPIIILICIVCYRINNQSITLYVLYVTVSTANHYVNMYCMLSYQQPIHYFICIVRYSINNQSI